MSYLNVIEAFEKGESGTDSFKSLYKSLLKLMQTDPSHAAACYIIASAAHNYVLRYEDQAIDVQVADAAKAVLTELCQRYAATIDRPAEERIAALNSIARDYEWGVANF